MFIGARKVSKTRPVLSQVADMSIDDAQKCGPYGKNDVPCVVVCGGKRYEWVSRRAARFFFSVAGRCCDGCEAERYFRIADALENGATEASDGIPVVFKPKTEVPVDGEKQLAEMTARRDALAERMDYLRERGCFSAARKVASDWNDLTLEIIRLSRALREKS